MGDTDDPPDQDIRAQLKSLQELVANLAAQRRPPSPVASSSAISDTTELSRTPPTGFKRKRRDEPEDEGQESEEEGEAYAPYCPRPDQKCQTWQLARNQEELFLKHYQNFLDVQARTVLF